MLHYHKCNDCLTAFTTVEDHVDFCDCGGDVTYMGEVQGSRYVRHADRSPCDGRCTHASGPICDCVCQGANHGNGKLVKVKVADGVVKADGLTPEDIERAVKYRVVRDYAQGMVNAVMEHWSRSSLQRVLDRIIDMRQYDPRIKALYDFIIKHKKT